MPARNGTRGRVHMPRCAIAGVEATIAETARAFPRHSHDRFGVGLIVSGGHKSASGRGPVEARMNDVITVNPGEVHDGSPLDERGRAWHMLYFEPSMLAGATAELGGVQTREVELTRPVVHDPLLKLLFERLFAVAVQPSDAGDDLAREQALLALIAHLLSAHASRDVGRALGRDLGRDVGRNLGRDTRRHVHASSLSRGPIARAKARIDDDPSAPLTLADLADEAGISRFRLLRSFAHETGLPPHAYRMQRRVVLARQLIARGVSLADAAAAAGFADQSHMTRAFVRLLGVTPANYAAATRR
ncbi:AraC family transcriptional regulator [Paraburkholderia phenoliruptrix]|uniref:AraC family transcriptional regulator n=1 Tax=Paraburkholderia phenoliruptrix TaxID=252970 RepID=UPI0001C03247|nr:AraC family transcriptional regulator [Paraburkholderia phenoliruptrix]MDR6390875.1 AraC-like DNA-binding protein [Paraburkholderia phenoliruptrix]WMY11899.1 AraC family transcriptional regulator [Paraburkholderia phenoliruptrix]